MSVEDNLIFPGYKNTVKFDLKSFYVIRMMRKSYVASQGPVTVMLGDDRLFLLSSPNITVTGPVRGLGFR